MKRIITLLILTIIIVLLYLINTYIFKDILFTNPISQILIPYITEFINILIYTLTEISSLLNDDLPDNSDITIPNEYKNLNIKNDNNKLNNKHLVTTVVISVMLFMIISDIYNLMDNKFIEELYSDIYNFEEALKANEKIMNNINEILKNTDWDN